MPMIDQVLPSETRTAPMGATRAESSAVFEDNRSARRSRQRTQRSSRIAPAD